MYPGLVAWLPQACNSDIYVTAVSMDCDAKLQYDVYRILADAVHYILGQQMPIQAIQYDDREGERITVVNDNDVFQMIRDHIETHSATWNTQPLIIYPQGSRFLGNRNVYKLKVQVKEEPHENNADKDYQLPAEAEQPGSRRQKSGDIQSILAGGSIVDSDLLYLSILGHGNCGTVHLAQHKPSGTVMAVKHIPLDISIDTQRQIIAELDILYQCHSPFIISFYGAYFMESRISMCTEYMDGGSLDRYGQIPEKILGCVAVSVVKGLQYLWSKKIMHRDVKPSNMLVNTSGQVKLCDFGVSVQLIGSIAKTFIGSNAYMAPERIAGEEYGIHSEVWSIGVSFYEMAMGKAAFESPTDLIKIITDQNSPKLPCTGQFTEPFVNFVSDCMQKIPQQRPSLEALMLHSFIIAHNNDKLENSISRWVQICLRHQSSHPLNVSHQATR